jgi:hypothetical protein
VSVVLKSLLERNYAAEYAARAEEVKAEAQVVPFFAATDCSGDVSFAFSDIERG